MAIKSKACPDFRNIYFVGRNYVKHIEELRNKQPEHPLIFVKPVSCAITSGSIPYPIHTQNLHFEGEMVFLLPGPSSVLSDIDHFWVSCGIDFTARDVQSRIKKEGWPWFEAKCFRGSAVISRTFVQVSRNQLSNLRVETWVNGEQRQAGEYNQTIFSLPSLVQHLEFLVEIQENDILFTGTPSGVGEVQPHDRIEVRLFLDGIRLTEKLCEVV